MSDLKAAIDAKNNARIALEKCHNELLDAKEAYEDSITTAQFRKSDLDKIGAELQTAVEAFSDTFQPLHEARLQGRGQVMTEVELLKAEQRRFDKLHPEELYRLKVELMDRQLGLIAEIDALDERIAALHGS